MIRIEDKTISLSVRDLIHYQPNPRKVLSSFPLPQRGLLGKKAQSKLQQTKKNSYGLFHKEIFVSHRFNHKKYKITLQGRIDGLYELPEQVEVEEIKSVIMSNKEFLQVEIDSYPEYKEQVLIYCFLLSQQEDYKNIHPIITLINLINDKSRSFTFEFNPDPVYQLIIDRFDQIIENINQSHIRHIHRKKQLAKADFSLPEKRAEQEEIKKEVAATLNRGEHHMVSAPTGTGKTAAVLFPAIRYAITNKKQIIYVTSKNTQQKIIHKTLMPIIESGLDLSVCFLRASKDMCANDVLFCHEDYCPYVVNYQNESLKKALYQKLLQEKIIESEMIFAYSKAEKICPAEIMFDLAANCDILVGDYNYIFDPRVQLKHLIYTKKLYDWILIIDEAHNLYQRSVDILSPEIMRRSLMDLSKALLNGKLKVYRDLKNSISVLDKMFKSLQMEGETHFSEQQYFTFDIDVDSWKNTFREYERAFIKYLMFKIRKNMLLVDDPFETFYYQLRGLIKIAEFDNQTFVSFYDAARKGRIKIQCCDPSEHLNGIINKFSTAIAMSATLDPVSYYKEVLGFPEKSTNITEVNSPFSAQNRQIIIVPTISTYYKDRANLYDRYAEIVKETLSVKKGNYIVFGPSFEFIQNVYLYLGSLKSEIYCQKRSMTENDRSYILNQFEDDSDPKLLMAVMGGIFSEGVDFKENMCIGVIIFSPALPQMTFERELIRRYFDQKTGEGFNYAYLYPGINKVIQSVGRMIRSQEDKGIIVLAGERFARDEINQLFPDYWFENEGDVVITDKLKGTIKKFWQRFE